MHFLMDIAVVEGVLRRLPAFVLIASVDAALLHLVLAEVEALLREHLGSN